MKLRVTVTSIVDIDPKDFDVETTEELIEKIDEYIEDGTNELLDYIDEDDLEYWIEPVEVTDDSPGTS